MLILMCHGQDRRLATLAAMQQAKEEQEKKKEKEREQLKVLRDQQRRQVAEMEFKVCWHHVEPFIDLIVSLHVKFLNLLAKKIPSVFY